jgi:addiction module HigA family antidote
MAASGLGQSRLVKIKGFWVGQQSGAVDRGAAFRAKGKLSDEAWVVNLVALASNVEIEDRAHEFGQLLIPILGVHHGWRNIADRMAAFFGHGLSILSLAGRIHVRRLHGNNSSCKLYNMQLEYDEIRSKMRKQMRALHPGDLITRRYLQPLGLTAQDLAAAMDISKSQLSRVLNAKCGVTADVALRLQFVLGSSAEMWMNLQKSYDLAKASETFKPTNLTCLTHLWYNEGAPDNDNQEPKNE